MSRVLAILGGIAVLALLAGGLTEATLAFGHRGGISDDTSLRPVMTMHMVTPSPTNKPSVTPTPVLVTPQATPTPTSSGSTAMTNSFVHLRASTSTSSAILANLDGGTTVRLLPYTDSLWQEVEYNGTAGYIYKTYLTY